MSRYVLQVLAPYSRGDMSENANRLSFALESLAVIHGGKVVEPSDASAQTAYHRQFVNIYDCESTLEKEVEWLKREFPQVQFALKQFMQDEQPPRQPQENPMESGKP
jgi:hypothetical protein